MKRPTRKAASVAAVAGLLVIAGSTAQAGWLFVLAAGVLGLVAGSALVRHPLAMLEPGMRLPARVRVGDEVAITTTISNRGRRRSPLLQIVARHPAFEPQVLAADPVAPGAAADATVVATATRRGRFERAELRLVTAWPFGLIRSSRTTTVPAEVTVVPRWAELDSFPILEPSSFPSEPLHERALTGAGREFAGVREYRPGDPFRHVHWRTSARAGRLVVREFEEHARSHVCLVLTGADVGDPPDSPFEALVGAAASIARYAIATGHPVDVVANAGEQPSRTSNVDRTRVLDFLACVTPGEAAPMALLPAAIAGAGPHATFVLMTTSVGSSLRDLLDAVRSVQAAGARAIAVVAAASSWGDERALAGEAQVLDALRARANVRVLTREREMRACLQA